MLTPITASVLALQAEAACNALADAGLPPSALFGIAQGGLFATENPSSAGAFAQVQTPGGTGPGTIRLARAAMVGVGFRAQRLAHGIGRYRGMQLLDKEGRVEEALFEQVAFEGAAAKATSGRTSPARP